jgi:hypothetical protein
MTDSEISNDLVAICKTGDFATPGEKYWADDVVSVEAGGPPGMDPVSRGKAAAAAKGEWWSNAIAAEQNVTVVIATAAKR